MDTPPLHKEYAQTSFFLNQGRGGKYYPREAKNRLIHELMTLNKLLSAKNIDTIATGDIHEKRIGLAYISELFHDDKHLGLLVIEDITDNNGYLTEDDIEENFVIPHVKVTFIADQKEMLATTEKFFNSPSDVMPGYLNDYFLNSTDKAILFGREMKNKINFYSNLEDALGKAIDNNPSIKQKNAAILKIA